MNIETLKQTIAMVEECGSVSEAARRLELSRSTVQNRLDVARIKNLLPSKDATNQKRPEWSERRERDYWVIESSDPRLSTVEDCLAKAGVDTDIWEVESVAVNGWDVTMKIRGKGEDKPFRGQNQSIRIKLRRKVPFPAEQAATALIERMKKYSPNYKAFKREKSPGDHLLEISVFDAHFGKLCWQPETGNNYDLRIAEKIYLNAVNDLLAKASGFNIEQIVFPVGQDFLHVNDHTNLTPTNQNRLDVEGRLGKVWTIATTALVKALERCAQIAPTKVLWVPGNHDPDSSFFICEFLRAWFQEHKSIVVDNGHAPRKCVTYGVNFVGFAHGDAIPLHDLPLVFEPEFREQMQGVKHTEIHVGHFHKRKRVRWIDIDTLRGGWLVRVLPSLSGTDYWHYIHGFTGSTRAAEAYLYHKTRGYAGHVSSNVAD